MINVTVITQSDRFNDSFPENFTVKQVLDYFKVGYEKATNQIDGARLQPGDLNKTLEQLGAQGSCRISSIVKMDNAVSVTAHGANAVLESGVDLKDWKRIQTYMPEALKILDEDNNVIFKVMVATGKGSADSNGVVFGDYTDNDKATVTLPLKPEKKKEQIRDMLGTALLRLNELEAQVPEFLKTIDEREKTIDGFIHA